VVLAMTLREDAFTPEQKARNFNYYERLTVRDSSLAAATQAVMAAEVGHTRLAYDYAREAALIDLHHLEHNTRWCPPGGPRRRTDRADPGLCAHARPRRPAHLRATAAGWTNAPGLSSRQRRSLHYARL
jgi:hypothetical protein